VVVGLIGAGNMARALARGWGEPILCTDSGSGRAAELARELGGEAVATNAELADRADLVVLCHKPRQLADVANEISGRAKAVASVLGAVTVARLQEAYPDVPVFRFMPNTPVELRRGVVCYAPTPGIDPAAEAQVLDQFRRVATVVEVDESLMELATGVMGVGPAYLALVVEAWTDAVAKRGLPRELASELAARTMAGTAELLEARGGDASAVRREVTSPGGITERGIAALEEAGLRHAFDAAVEAALGGSQAVGASA
jgi:pyrroline-5-carboxylate reductase